ncbi:hypothetical protein TUM17567_28400 [Citrobacter amalonaticus]|nr:hypothetical protein TUM17567_28400 [Citrobacter amalonaticus]
MCLVASTATTLHAQIVHKTRLTLSYALNLTVLFRVASALAAHVHPAYFCKLSGMRMFTALLKRETVRLTIRRFSSQAGAFALR